MSSPTEKPRRRPVLVPVLLVLIAVAAAGWAREVATTPEYVDVLVTTKELKGDILTASEADECTTTKRIPQSIVPRGAITNKGDLVGKRLKNYIREGDCVVVADLVSEPRYFGLERSKFPVILETTADVYTFQVPWPGNVVAGSRVDVVGSVSINKSLKVLTVLPDVYVMAISPNAPQMGAARTAMVSLAATEDEAKLLLLARSRGMKPELLLRDLDAPQRYPHPLMRENARKHVFHSLASPDDIGCFE